MRLRTTLVGIVVALELAGCTGMDGSESAHSQFRGVQLSQPKAKADFVLTDDRSRDFHFQRETDGYLTFLFFGYTNCPDVCPVHLTNLSAVIRDLPQSQRAKIKVVFITTDPDRDTPERMREWLGHFDSSFVGLRGSAQEIARVERLFDVVSAPTAHSAQIFAFTTDNVAHFVYPFGTRQADWANDIPMLLDEQWVEQLRASGKPPRRIG